MQPIAALLPGPSHPGREQILKEGFAASEAFLQDLFAAGMGGAW